MPSHAFTSNPPDDLLTIKVGAPPAGATALAISCQLIPPPNPGPETVRLLHLRRAGASLKPAASEVVEILFNGSTGQYTAGFSGFGAKHAKAMPVHMGKVTGAPVDVHLTVPIGAGEATVVVGPLSAHAAPDLAALGNLELLVGFTGPGDLRPPTGWTVLWDDGALRWVTAGAPPVLPPALPPTPPPGPGQIDPQVGPTPPAPVVPPPVAPPAGTDARAILFQALLQQLPPEEATVFRPIIADLIAGKPLNRQTLLLALLPLLLGGGR